MEDPMNSELSFQTAFCSEYESLLHQSQSAKEASAEWRDEMNAAATGQINSDVADEMIRLQANFAKAYSRLEQHNRDCDLCRFVTRITQHQRQFAQAPCVVEQTWPA
jgi:hypothetical protein